MEADCRTVFFFFRFVWVGLIKGVCVRPLIQHPCPYARGVTPLGSIDCGSKF